MLDDHKIIEAICRKYTNANDISQALILVTTIQKTKSSYIWKKQDLQNELIINLQKIDKDILELQNRCPHYSTTYYGDPSGGNDSYTCCDICGMSWRGNKEIE